MKLIAEMRGRSGFPSAEYCRKLWYDKVNGLKIHNVEEDWYDVVNVNGKVEYEHVDIEYWERINISEARNLMWDYTYEGFNAIF